MTPAECNEKYYTCTCGEMYKSRNLVAPDCPLHSIASEEALAAYGRWLAIDFGMYIRFDYQETKTTEEIFDDYLKTCSRLKEVDFSKLPSQQ